MPKSHLLSVTVTLLLACAPSEQVQTRSQLEQDLVSAVILQTVQRLPNSADSASLAAYKAPTPDSARALFSSMWASSWHNAGQNGVKLSPALLDRFAQHLDTKSPPPEPYADVPNWYQVRELRIGSDSVTADIGPRYAGCKYSFTRQGRDWMLVGEPRDCWIS
jgi:hypothetical protein